MPFSAPWPSSASRMSCSEPTTAPTLVRFSPGFETSGTNARVDRPGGSATEGGRDDGGYQERRAGRGRAPGPPSGHEPDRDRQVIYWQSHLLPLKGGKVSTLVRWKGARELSQLQGEMGRLLSGLYENRSNRSWVRSLESGRQTGDRLCVRPPWSRRGTDLDRGSRRHADCQRRAREDNGGERGPLLPV